MPESSEESEIDDATISTESLPKKSKERYKREYTLFLAWFKQKEETEYTENVLLDYFTEKSKIMKSSTLWSTYSMLRCTLLLEDGVDISRFRQLLTFLKQFSVGYQAKRSETFRKEEINEFLQNAPDEEFLLMKVVLIIGVAGACRREEFVRMSIDNIDDQNSLLLVTIPEYKSHKSRTFTVTQDEDWLRFYRKYATLRPKNIQHARFFLNYRHGRCTIQPIGLNTFGQIPRKIAEYLKLSNPSCYTGHCFRRTSAHLLANVRVDLQSIFNENGRQSSMESHSEENKMAKFSMLNEYFGMNNGTKRPTESELQTDVKKSRIEDTPSTSLVDIKTEPESDDFDLHNVSDPLGSTIKGNRIVSVQYYFEQLQKISLHNPVKGCAFSHLRLLTEERSGLNSQLEIHCENCGENFPALLTDPGVSKNVDLNKSIVTYQVREKLEYEGLKTMLDSVDVPAMSEDKFLEVAKGTEVRDVFIKGEPDLDIKEDLEEY